MKTKREKPLLQTFIVCGSTLLALMASPAQSSASWFMTYGDGDNPLEKEAFALFNAVTENVKASPNAHSPQCGQAVAAVTSLQRLVAHAERTVAADMKALPPSPLIEMEIFEVGVLESLYGNTLAKIRTSCDTASYPAKGSQEEHFLHAAQEQFNRANNNKDQCTPAFNGMANLFQQELNESTMNVAESLAPRAERSTARELLIYLGLLQERCIGPRWMHRLKVKGVKDRALLENASRRLLQKYNAQLHPN